MMAAMKKVLSPISEARIIPHDLTKPCRCGIAPQFTDSKVLWLIRQITDLNVDMEGHNQRRAGRDSGSASVRSDSGRAASKTLSVLATYYA